MAAAAMAFVGLAMCRQRAVGGSLPDTVGWYGYNGACVLHRGTVDRRVLPGRDGLLARPLGVAVDAEWLVAWSADEAALWVVPRDGVGRWITPNLGGSLDWQTPVVLGAGCAYVTIRVPASPHRALAEVDLASGQATRVAGVESASTAGVPGHLAVRLNDGTVAVWAAEAPERPIASWAWPWPAAGPWAVDLRSERAYGVGPGWEGGRLLARGLGGGLVRRLGQGHAVRTDDTGQVWMSTGRPADQGCILSLLAPSGRCLRRLAVAERRVWPLGALTVGAAAMIRRLPRAVALVVTNHSPETLEVHSVRAGASRMEGWVPAEAMQRFPDAFAEGDAEVGYQVWRQGSLVLATDLDRPLVGELARDGWHVVVKSAQP